MEKWAENIYNQVIVSWKIEIWLKKKRQCAYQ